MTSILFDADGVVLVSIRFSTWYETEHGLPPGQMQPFFTGPFLECIIGKDDLKDLLVPYLKKWGFTGSADEFLGLWFSYDVTPDMQLMEFIQKLRVKSDRCYLATNQEKYRARYIEENIGMMFDGIFSSSEIGYKKPEQEFFNHIISEVPGKIIFFDDSAGHVEAAKKAGIDAYLYSGLESCQAILRSL